jgi:hypothetical protein
MIEVRSAGNGVSDIEFKLNREVYCFLFIIVALS